jgi:hypothetical protein
MSFVRRFLTATSAFAIVSMLGGAPQLAHAAGVPAAANDAATRASLEAERQRLRGDLQHVNAEIASLKRADRGMRDDYRLRARLADAEALARRLTELDARLGHTPDRPADRSMLATEPRALPGDGPAELEAKADILSDESHRLAARAESILGRARDLRTRQNLRRHVGQMERDPFSPLEGSKRRALTSGLAASMPAKGNGTGTVVPTAPGPDRGMTGVASDTTTGNSQSASPGVTPAPPAVGGSTAVSAPGGAPVGMTTAPGATTPATTKEGAGVVAPSTPHLGPSGVSDGAATLSVQLRDLLDPATLAEIQRLEAAGGANSGFEALERAGAALKARADRLAQQASSLRAREHVPPRAR